MAQTCHRRPLGAARAARRSTPVHDHGDMPSVRRRVPAARKLVRVIARKSLRPAETLRRPHDNPPPSARHRSITRQPSAQNTATLRGQHDNAPPTATLGLAARQQPHQRADDGVDGLYPASHGRLGSRTWCATASITRSMFRDAATLHDPCGVPSVITMPGCPATSCYRAWGARPDTLS